MADNNFSVQYNTQGGNNDPGDGNGALPSSDTAQRGTPAPLPYFISNPTVAIVGSPIMGNPVITDQLHLGEWKIYSKNNKLYASDGLHELQFVMVNPGGLEQKSKPNKLSDGSDGSSGQSAGNTAVSGRTVPQGPPVPAAGSTPAGTSNNVPAGSNVDNILRTLRTRESSNNYTARATTSSASGAYQFTNDTWASVSAKAGYGGRYGTAADAPPAVQDAVARWYVNDILQRANGDINAVPNEWYTGRINGQMTQAQLAANNGLTSAQYRSNFFGTFNSINGSSGTPTAYASTETPNNSSNFSAVGGIGKVTAQIPTGNNIINKGVDAVAGQVTPASLSQQNSTLSCVPCIPNEIAAEFNKLTPGGLVGLVLDLSDVTNELSKITKKITQLLPGVPFSVTAAIVQEFVDGFKGLNETLTAVNKELNTGLQTIVQTLNCVSADLNAVSAGINKTIASYSPDQFIKILPANLSIDDVIDGKANSALLNIKLADTTKPRPKFTEEGVPIFYQDQVNRPTFTTTAATEAVVAEDVVEPTQDVSEPEIKVLINTPETVIDIPDTFTSTNNFAKPLIEQALDRTVSEKEWSNLICAAFASCSTDQKEYAWFVKTVINRSKISGLSIVEILQEFPHVKNKTGKFVLGPMHDSEMFINLSLTNYFNAIPSNNYYIDSFSPESQQLGITYQAQRKGIPGIAVGQSFVYPGAKWP